MLDAAGLRDALSAVRTQALLSLVDQDRLRRG